jgi:hypothetical protein
MAKQPNQEMSMSYDFNDAPTQTELETKLKQLDARIETLAQHTMYLSNGCPAWLTMEQSKNDNYIEDEWRNMIDTLCARTCRMGIPLSRLLIEVTNHFSVSVSDFAGDPDYCDRYDDENT